VKWWEKFPQTDTIIQTVYNDFAKKNPASRAIPIAASKTIPADKLITLKDLLPPLEKEKTDVEKPVASSSSSKTKKF
jgi:hypothetical protein